MLDVKTICNSIGIILSMIGVCVIYVYSPLNNSIIDGGNAFSENNNSTIDKKNNFCMKIGVLIVLLGSLIQLISNFIP